ncbi:MAG TPA: hypothetical protein ENG63_03680 [Candidatus Desulfofervidus auxilii]|uniref:Peptidase M48 domain-containing protein n=1 Tax=Desulfofervidus auxilii TaxID=1621989 RepID=A0A7C0Y2E7_DESA2|nr:hypothetical protein [Candidatus Desulfofervidus auxilii]
MKKIILFFICFVFACTTVKIPVTSEEKFEAEVEIAVEEWKGWYNDLRRVSNIFYKILKSISAEESLKGKIIFPSKKPFWDDGIRHIELKKLNKIDHKALEVITGKMLPKDGYILLPLPSMPAEVLIKPWSFAKKFNFDKEKHTFTYLVNGKEIKIKAVAFPIWIHFFVSMSREINAYASKGKNGYFIVIHRGICHFLPDDNQLAFVISHEIAHILRGHLKKRVGVNLITGILATGIAIATGISDLANIVYAGVMAKYSRDQEREADFFGLYFTYLSGYNIELASKAFITLGSSAPRSLLENFFATHPYDAERRAYLKKVVNWIKEGKTWQQIIREH